MAERRVCSVLFADLLGFTPLPESLDPDAVRELLSRYFETARTVIGRYGGVVDKFIGNAVMAVWSTPTATEADAERAVRAALDLVAAVGLLGAEAGAVGLAALRGDTEAAATALATLPGLRPSENPQDTAMASTLEAFTAACSQAAGTLRHTRATFSHVGTLGISHDLLRWVWPRAARAAWYLNDPGTTGELPALLDGHPPGHLVCMLRAERDLAGARLAARSGDQCADTAFTSAIGPLRAVSTPYHLAHGLLHHVRHLSRSGDNAAAAAVLDEACDIARRLQCQPLLDQVAELTPTRPRVGA